MNIIPLFDRIVVKMLEKKQATDSGIILPSAAKEDCQIAKVVAAGPEYTEEQTGVTLYVGDIVIVEKYMGNEILLDGEKYIIIEQADVLAKLEGDENTNEQCI